MTYAAVQTISGGTPVAINANGVADGVAFIGQGVTPSTLTVGNGQNINNDDNAVGVSTDSPSVGTILFEGNSEASIVNGTVGAINSMSNIQAGLGSASTTFNGVVSAATFDVTGNGTVQFNTTANAALTFHADGNMVMGSGATYNGAVNNLAANSGSLTLNAASILNGAAGSTVGALKQVTVTGGNATINGALSSTNFTLGTNTLSLVGALALPIGTTINITAISDTLFGNINAAGHNDNITAPSVQINVNATSAILTGAPLFVVNAGAGSSGVPVNVTSNTIRYTFVGNNLDGSITILPTLIPAKQVVTNPAACAVGTVFDALIPIAAAHPGSDLAFVETALTALPTVAAYENALIQIAPTSGLVGVGQESFNTTRQFQKVWLEHLHRNRQYCLFQNQNLCCDPCDNLCGEVCDTPMIWTDGFGYFGHQDRKDQLNGYKVNTWGTTLAIEKMVCDYLWVGLGGGYAYSDLDESEFKNKTHINNYEGTVYLGYYPNPWFIDAGFSYGWNRYDGKRNISFTGVDRRARAKYDGQSYTGFGVTGYQYNWDCLEITPFASVLYSHLHVDKYKEKGANSLNLHMKKQKYDFTESGLGLKLAYLYQTNCGLFIPEIHSIWLHDFNRRSLFVDATFTGIGAAAGSFANKGPRTDQNIWNIGASITCMASDSFSVQAVYDYERSSHYYDHQGLIELGYFY